MVLPHWLIAKVEVEGTEWRQQWSGTGAGEGEGWVRDCVFE